MSENGAGDTVRGVFADTGSHEHGAGQGDPAAHGVDDGGAGEVDHRRGQLGQPAAAPDPVTGHGVDERGDDEAQDEVGNEFGPFGDGARNDGDGGGGEHALEEPVGVGPQTIGGGGGGFGQAEVGGADETAEVGPEHEGVAEQEKGDGAGGEVEHVLHEDVAGVLGPGEPGLDHGETGLHEHDKGGGDEGPHRVAVHDRDEFRGLFGGFLGQGQAGQGQDGQRNRGQGQGCAFFVKTLSACHTPPLSWKML